MYKYILIYLVIINLLGAFVNIIDKQKAKHKKWRIPEATLWLFGILGGSFGSYITMKAIRHKTKHKAFMIGMPLLTVIQTAILIYFFVALSN